MKKCPRCATEMQANSIAQPSDHQQLVTCWMCPCCFKRVMEQSRNPHSPVMMKAPVVTGTHEHKQRRGMIRTAAVDIEGNGQ